MKKTLFFGWLVALIVLAFPALSSAQFQSALTVSGEENTVEMIVVCPDGSVLTADGQDCVSTEPAPAPAEEPANAATPTVLGTETAVTAEPAINTAVKTNTQPADTAVIAPLEDTKEITGVS